ncbi:hypothetical protein [Blastococcus capsensis]|uniref:hypothetical protein n=1 Tax=Blastococcus capsensis TaxID=1564163 RepID=UPI0025412955|nr:hypothetical protein [Blastococcus capsensis]MDK3254916.1 hypothetical protein [Blastococcus capsensis]
MTERHPDTDNRGEPGGTPTPGPDDLIDKPTTPGAGNGGTVTPGVYDADEDDRERGKAAKPGN